MFEKQTSVQVLRFFCAEITAGGIREVRRFFTECEFFFFAMAFFGV